MEKSARLHYVLAILAVLTASILPYLNTLPNEFVLDDLFFVAGNKTVSGGDWLAFFTRDFIGFAHDELEVGYFRPLVNLSWWLDSLIYGENPAGYHVTNFTLHALAALAVLGLALALEFGLGPALAAGILFAVHPAHTESVAWISGRTDVLCTLFYVTSLAAYLGRVRGSYWVSLSAFLGALLAKEMSYTLPLVIMALDWLLISRRDFKSWSKRAGLMAGYWALLAAAVCYKKHMLHLGSMVPFIPDFSQWGINLLTFGRALMYYLKVLAAPIRLVFEPLIYEESRLSAAAVFAYLAVLGTLTAAFFYRSRKPDLSFLILFFWLSFLPITNFLPLNINQDLAFPAAERFLYLPSVGFSLLGGLLCRSVFVPASPKMKTAVLVMITLGFTALAIKTADRNRVWRNVKTLCTATLAVSPASAYKRTLLAEYYYQHRDREQAIKELKQAVALSPHPYIAYDLLGKIFLEEKRWPEARAAFTAALKDRPSAWQALFYLGKAEEGLGQEDEARRRLLQSFELRPNASAAIALGDSYLRQKDFRRAEEYYRRALLLNSRKADAYYRLGRLLWNRNDQIGALEYLETAARLDPDLCPVKIDLGRLLSLKRDFNRANLYLEDYLKCNPADLQGTFLLGLNRLRLNHPEAAWRSFALVSEKDPRYPDLHLWRARTLAAMQKTEAAQEEWEEHLRQNPRDRQAAEELALLKKRFYNSGRRP